MNLEDRIWNLDKGEASSLRTYFGSITWHHEEIDTIIAQNWDIVKTKKLLSKSIIRRMSAFYKSSRVYADKLNRQLGTEAGKYFEDLIFLPLKALLNEKFGENRFILSREKKIKILGRRKPDIIILYKDQPICVIECVVWLDSSRYDEMKSKHSICENHNIFFACVAGTIYGEELKGKLKGIAYWLIENFFTDIKEYERITIIHPIENIFGKIVEKCNSVINQ